MQCGFWIWIDELPHVPRITSPREPLLLAHNTDVVDEKRYGVQIQGLQHAVDELRKKLKYVSIVLCMSWVALVCMAIFNL